MMSLEFSASAKHAYEKKKYPGLAGNRISEKFRVCNIVIMADPSEQITRLATLIALV
jgi:hypothetical protein